MYKMRNVKIYILIFFSLLVAGCATIKTTVTDPQGKVYVVESKKDALVTYKKDDVNLVVDNRGKMGIFENLMGIMLMKTEINLKNKDGD